MSYDIFVQDLPPGVQRVEELPEDFRPLPLGSRGWIVAAIRRVAPEVDFAQPTWGTIELEGSSIEINLGVEDPVQSFAFHVRGGDRGLFLISDILAELGLRALAPETDSGFFEVNEATEAFARWREYRDRVVARPD